MKASFLIPTNRNYKDYAQKVLETSKGFEHRKGGAK